MVIMSTPQQPCGDFVVPRRPCKRCGTRLRYRSGGNCVECKRVYNQATGDRRSMRKRCEDELRKMGVPLGETRHEKDVNIICHFPGMGPYLKDKFGVELWEKE